MLKLFNNFRSQIDDLVLANNSHRSVSSHSKSKHSSELSKRSSSCSSQPVHEHFGTVVHGVNFILIHERETQEVYIEELTRFSQCLNAKTGFVNFWSVYQPFLYWIFMFQIVHFQKILEGQCLNKIRLTAPLYILLAFNLSSDIHLSKWTLLQPSGGILSLAKGTRKVAFSLAMIASQREAEVTHAPDEIKMFL